jgi:hypothetical protein
MAKLKMKRRNFFIHDRLWEKLQAVADADGIGVSEVLRRAIVELIKREEAEKPTE